MGELYQIVTKNDSKQLSAYLSENGQALLPMVELIEQGQMVVEEFIDVLGRAALGAVLELSAAQIAGPPHQGKPGGEVRRHGRRASGVRLSTQKVRVDRPRLRNKSGGEGAEVAVPAYVAMQSDPSLGERLCAILMSGVSTRNYQRVVPQMAESCGVSKSAVRREFAAAGAEQLKALCERRFDEVELLIIYLDGVRFGEHRVIVAIGVDSEGHKHLPGLAEGATENATVVRGLLEDLVQRGMSPDRRRLFVIDGSKALRSAIDAVFGAGNPVQRCLGTTNIVESPTSGVRLRTRRVSNWRHGQMVLRWAAAA